MTCIGPHDSKSQEKYNQFFTNTVNARSQWGEKAHQLKKTCKRLVDVPDWRGPSEMAQYKSVVHRWDTDKTCRERQSAQCLWTRDDAIMYDASIQFALKLAKENLNNSEVKFSWEYRQTADFRRRYRPRSTVQSRHGGSGTFSHRHPPTAAQCGASVLRKDRVNQSLRGGDPKASDTSMTDAQEAKPGQTDEEFARELSDHQYAMQLQYREESRSSRWYDSPVGGDFSANAWSHARRGACRNCVYPGHHANACPVRRDAP